MDIIIDFDRKTIMIDNDEPIDVAEVRRDNNIQNGKIIYSPLILVYLLNKCYPYLPDNYQDILEDFDKMFKIEKQKPAGDIRKIRDSVKALNACLKNYPELKIERNVTEGGIEKYGFTENISNAIIEWTSVGSSDIVDIYGVPSIWLESEQSQSSFGEKIASSVHDLPVKANKISSREEEVVVWNGELIGSIRSEYEAIALNIKENLLPFVSVNDGVKKDRRLKDFLINDYTNEKSGKSFVMIEGEMGSGKSYSLYSVAKEMYDLGHVVILIPLYILYAGRGSLIDHIDRYIEGGSGMHPLQRVKKRLLQASDNQKVMIIIDSVDETFPGVYSDLGRDISKLIEIENPNVSLVLAGRTGTPFLENSGLKDVGCTTIKCNEITEKSILRNSNNEHLIKIMREYPDTRTPLFISFYDEISQNQRLVSRREGLDSYAEGINYEFDVKAINNYYDLFQAKTALMIGHAIKDTGNADLYSKVLPYLAYNTTIRKDRLLGREDIDSVDIIAFDCASYEEKCAILVNTGVVKYSFAEGQLEFCIDDYMQFLAARYAYEKYLVGDLAPLDVALRKTSYANRSKVSRINKRRFISYGYYLFLYLVKNIDCSSRLLKDGKVYKLGANAVFEFKNLWESILPLTDYYLDCEKKWIFESIKKETDINAFDLIDGVNVIDYTSINIKMGPEINRAIMLDKIEAHFYSCIGIVMKELYSYLGEDAIYYAETKQGCGGAFCTHAIQFLIKRIETGETFGEIFKERADLIGRLYSNLGACKLAQSQLNEDVKLLDAAMKFHNLAKDYREILLAKRLVEKSKAGLIRSYVTLGTDMFYKGKWEDDSEQAVKCFEEAINKYHKKALELQGVKINKDIVDTRVVNSYRDINLEAEPHVILLLVAGCYYMCYIRDVNSNYEYLIKQQKMLDMATLFLMDECKSDEDSNSLDNTKLEVNTREIDKMWNDVKEKYVNSFSNLIGDDRKVALDTLDRIRTIYTTLHTRAGNLVIVDDGKSFVITEKEMER